jgi:TolB protein
MDSKAFPRPLTGALLFLAAFVAASPAQATFPGRNGKIAYENQFFSVFVINPDGSGLMKLISDPPINSGPAWSFDGTQLAFAGSENLNSPPDIYVTNADGTAPRRLTNTPGFEGAPAWSPDGTTIAFARSDPPAYVNQIYTMNADGSDPVNISNSPNNNFDPDWSPDGRKIAFDAGGNIWTMNPDGSGKTSLTHDTNAHSDFYPSWSPDGKKIAFESILEPTPDAHFQDSFLYVMNADGSEQTNLVPSGEQASRPAWSPDGQKIAFEVNFFAIHLVNADGSGEVYFNPGQGTISRLDWQPIPSPQRGDYKNAAQFCKAERTFWGDQFVGRYGGRASAYGKCVSSN